MCAIACRFSRLQDQQNFPMGAEGAGIVVACGSNVAGSLQPGQHVACNSASFAEYAAVPARLCQPVRTANAEAAAMALSGVFGCAVMRYTAGVKRGSRVLITAGAGAHLRLQASRDASVACAFQVALHVC